ncbi:MAG: hypothetical protein WB760_05490 [Xanthobacteraceae bacterium]
MKTALITSKEFGPMMGRLTVQEQIFVCNLFMGVSGITKAAELAGYQSITRNGLRVMAHRLLRRKDIAEAVKEEAKRRTTFLLPKAQTALEYILDNPQHADHFKAIKMARDDSGVSVAVERVLNLNVKVEVTQAEKVQQIKVMAATLGLDATKLLGYTPDEPVDAEFEEVTDSGIGADDELMGLA